MKTYASLIIGYPNQDEMSINKTVEFVKKIDPDYYGFAIAMPYPSCNMYFTAKSAGLIQRNFIDYKVGEYVLISPELKKPINEYMTNANASILNHKKSWLHRFRNIFIKNVIIPTPFINSNELDVKIEILDQTEKIVKNNKFLIKVLVTNNSPFDLISLPPFPVHISYHWKEKNLNYLLWDGARTSIDYPLKSKEKREMLIDIISPSTTGTFELQLCIVQEGNKWYEYFNKTSIKQYSVF